MAADVNVLGLNIELQLRTQQFEDQLSSYMEKQTEDLAQKFSEAFSKAASNSAATGLGQFFENLATDTASAAVSLDGLFKSLGNISSAAASSGIDIKAMRDALDAINIGRQLRQTEDLNKLYGDLGVAVENYKNAIANADETPLTGEALANARKMYDDMMRVRDAIDVKNEGHIEQNDLMKESNDLIESMPDGLQESAASLEDIGKAAKYTEAILGSILRAIMASAEAADEFASVNYRAYGSSEDILRTTDIMALKYGILGKEAIAATKALGAFAIDPTKLENLVDVSAKFSRVAGVSVEESAKFVRNLTMIGVEGKNLDDVIMDVSDNMRAFGLTGDEATGMVSKLGMSAAYFNRTMGPEKFAKLTVAASRLAGVTKKLGGNVDEMNQYAAKFAESDFDTMVGLMAATGMPKIETKDFEKAMVMAGQTAESILGQFEKDSIEYKMAYESVAESFFAGNKTALDNALKQQDMFGEFLEANNLQMADREVAMALYLGQLGQEFKKQKNLEELYKESMNLTRQYDKFKSNLEAIADFVLSVFWPGLSVIFFSLNYVFLQLGAGLDYLKEMFKSLSPEAQQTLRVIGTILSVLLSLSVIAYGAIRVFRIFTSVLAFFRAMMSITTVTTTAAGGSMLATLQAIGSGIVTFVSRIAPFTPQIFSIAVSFLILAAAVAIVAASLLALSFAGPQLLKAGLIIAVVLIVMALALGLIAASAGVTVPVLYAIATAFVIMAAALLVASIAVLIVAYATTIVADSLIKMAESAGSIALLGLSLGLVGIGLLVVAAAGFIFAASMIFLAPALIVLAAAMSRLMIPALVISVALVVAAMAFKMMTEALLPLMANPAALVEVAYGFLVLGAGLLLTAVAAVVFSLAMLLLVPSIVALSGVLGALAVPLIAISIAMLIAAVAVQMISAAMLPLIENAAAMMEVAFSFVVLGIGLLITAAASVVFAAAMFLLVPSIVTLTGVLGALAVPLMLIAIAMVIAASAVQMISAAMVPLMENAEAFSQVALSFVVLGAGLLLVAVAGVIFAAAMVIVLPALVGLSAVLTSLATPLLMISVAMVIAATATQMISDAMLPLIENSAALMEAAFSFVVLGAGLLLTAAASVLFSAAMVLLVPAIGALTIALLALSVPIAAVASSFDIIANAAFKIRDAILSLVEHTDEVRAIAFAVSELAIALGFAAITSVLFSLSCILLVPAIIALAFAMGLLMIPLTVVAIATSILADAFMKINQAVMPLLDRVGDVFALGSAFVWLAIGMGLASLAGALFVLVSLFLVPAIIALAFALTLLVPPLVTIAFAFILMALAVENVVISLIALAGVVEPLLYVAMALVTITAALGVLSLISIPVTAALALLTGSLLAFGAALYFIRTSVSMVGMGIYLLGEGIANVANAKNALPAMKEFAQTVKDLRSSFKDLQNIDVEFQQLDTAVANITRISQNLAGPALMLAEESELLKGAGDNMMNAGIGMSIGAELISAAVATMEGVDTSIIITKLQELNNGVVDLSEGTSEVERLGAAIDNMANAIERLNNIGSLDFDMSSLANATSQMMEVSASMGDALQFDDGSVVSATEQLNVATSSLAGLNAELERVAALGDNMKRDEDRKDSSPISVVQVKDGNKKVAAPANMSAKIFGELKKLNEFLEDALDPENFKNEELLSLLRRYLPEIAEGEDPLDNALGSWTQ